jgi:hypothetical protein
MLPILWQIAESEDGRNVTNRNARYHGYIQ